MVALFVSIFILLLCALLVSNILTVLLKKKKLQFILNLLMLLLLFLCISGIYYAGDYALYANLVEITPFSLFFMGLFTLGLLISNLIFYQYSENYESLTLLSSFMLIGMYLVAASSSLITIFLGLELATMPMIFSILLSKKSMEASVKLFVMGSIAVALFSFGMVLVYGGTGSLNLSTSSNAPFLLFAFVLLIAALGFEASIFPFNLLIPDVYEGSPAYLTGVMGGINKKVGFAALIQILILIFIVYQSAFLVVAIFSVLTMFYGNLCALRQKNLKRMFAYSSIAQSGYILIGIATYSAAGITASLVQIFAHSIIFIGALAIIAWLEANNKQTVDNLVGLAHENRFGAFALAFFLLSLAGLPFTLGFVGKLLIFLSAINSGLLWLAAIGILNTMIALYYYAKPIIAMYSGTSRRKLPMPTLVLIAVVLCVLIVLLLGIYPQPLITFATNASAQLFR